MRSAGEVKKVRSRLRVIGGSGVDQLNGFVQTRWESIKSQFGDLSDKLLFRNLYGKEMVFLPQRFGNNSLGMGEPAWNIQDRPRAFSKGYASSILEQSICLGPESFWLELPTRTRNA